MKILVTGVDGFLGRAVANRLIEDGHAIVGLSDGAANDDRYPFFHADIAEPQAVAEVFRTARPQLCIHLAAAAHADARSQNASRLRRVNLDGALNVAEAGKNSGCRGMIFFSSAKVLADATGPEGIDEDTQPCPWGPYAELKAEAELALLERSKRTEMDIAVVRPVAVLGYGDSKGNYARLARAVDRGFFPLLDGGCARRSIVFSDRVAQRIGRMVSSGIKSARTYVFSDGVFGLKDIVDAMRTAIGFAWCPPVPAGLVASAARAVDPLWRAVHGRPSPLTFLHRRLVESFVVHAHRFDEDYGALPPFHLGAAMIEAYGRNLLGTDSR